jgi:COP9 signalosome complex subunit 6
LVIASACDHYTRVVVGGTKLPSNSPTYGLLFGTETGQEVSLCEATEALYELVDDKIVVLKDEIAKKANLWTAVYVNYKLLGWYTFGIDTTFDHMKFHEEMSFFHPSPIFLLINQSVQAEESNNLPISLFKSESIKNNGQYNQVFIEQQFFLEASEMEKISIDLITSSTIKTGVSRFETKTKSLITSLRTLDEKLGVMINLLHRMLEGSMEPDYEFIRKASKICSQLPCIDATGFENKFQEQIIDNLIINYLSSTAKSISIVNDLIVMSISSS